MLRENISQTFAVTHQIKTRIVWVRLIDAIKNTAELTSRDLTRLLEEPINLGNFKGELL